MSIFEKLMNGHKNKKGGEDGGDSGKELTLKEYKQKLKGIVYDDDLVEELAPVFTELHDLKGFDKVIELLETKEKQIEAISEGDFHEQQTTDQQEQQDQGLDEDESEKPSFTADQILTEKYSK